MIQSAANENPAGQSPRQSTSAPRGYCFAAYGAKVTPEAIFLANDRFAPKPVGHEFSSGEIQTVQHADAAVRRWSCLSFVNLNF